MMIRGILLAAGFGRRFDPDGQRDKLLTPLADGRPLLWHSARVLATALPGSLAIIRPGQQARAHCLVDAGCIALECEGPALGMGHTLAAGVAATPDATGWVLALADMPWLPVAAITAVAAALDHPRAVAAPTHASKRGHPVGFGADWGAHLRTLTGDTGARELLRSVEPHLIPWPDDSVLRDVDRPEDLLLS